MSDKHTPLPFIIIPTPESFEGKKYYYVQPKTEDCEDRNSMDWREKMYLWTIKTHHKDFAEYIIKACNAYPELVEGIKKTQRGLGAMETQSPQDFLDNQALLLKLGEI